MAYSVIWIKKGGEDMTNAEKFEKVFGLKIDENYPSDPCDMVDHDICVNADGCHNCPVYKFWEKEYIEEKEK